MSLILALEVVVGEEKCSFFFLKHWNEAKFIDRDPRSKRQFSERGCPRLKNTTTGELCDGGPPREQLTGIEDRNASITAVEKPTNHSRASSFITRPETSRPYRLMKTSRFSRNVAIHMISNQIVRQTIILNYCLCELLRM